MVMMWVSTLPRVDVSIGSRQLGGRIDEGGKEKQGYVIVHAHLLEDRRLVYVWMVCPGEKEEGEFRRKQERIN